MFAILKHKRYISAKDIYNIYWDKVADDLFSINMQTLDTDSTLATLSYRYCLLQRGLTSRYRCQKFESLLKELMLIEIKHGFSAWIPNRMTKMATFLIGYANDQFNHIVLPVSKFSFGTHLTLDLYLNNYCSILQAYFVERIEEMSPNFSVSEVMDISIGIECFHRNGIPKKYDA